jgi:hypothetical protein
MAKLTDEEKTQLKAATLESAVALVDDLSHIRDILAKPEPTTGDLRRLSAQLRRIRKCSSLLSCRPACKC